MFKVPMRYTILKVTLFAFLAIIAVRLFDIQVIHYSEYKAEAASKRIKQYELEAKRGEIYMMDGDEDVVPVVVNERTWTIFVDPSYVKSKEKVQATLDPILSDQMIISWDKVWENMKSQYVEIAKNVNYNTVAAVKEANLRGVGRKETSRRVYPSGELASQVLGFVNAEGVGSGVEGSLNNRLSGKNGMLKTVTDVNEIPLSIGDDNIEIPAENGENIVLTLDENVQRKVESILKNAMEQKPGIEKAAALVMNPNNGHIYAMANYPTYNPEEYWKVTDASLFTNLATESTYEPASVCKTFTYATAINEGVLDPTDTYYNTGVTMVDDRAIHNANGSVQHYGTITFNEALNYSLNTGSVEALRRLGGGQITKQARTTLYNYLTERFSLGKKTGIELYEEAGLIVSPEQEQGNAVKYANMTFGQGMNLTMVQVAAGFSALINNGDYYQPTIVAGVVNDDGEFIPKEKEKPKYQHAIGETTSATMREMLINVRKVNGGRADLPGYRVGVKTGTAETLKDDGSYTSDKTVAGALGFGGSGDGDTPEYVVLVRLNGDTLLWGAYDAVPIFTEISNYMLQYLRIQPAKQ